MTARFLAPLLVLACVLGAAEDRQDRNDRPAESPELTKQLEQIAARSGRIKDFKARFRQEKFTALLKKPLVSSGVVRVSGSTIRWDTEKPEPAVLYSDGKDVRLYYPAQELLEIYPIDQRLGDLAASPLPKLKTLREHFSLERAQPKLFPKADPRKSLPLRLIPLDDAIREHVEEVRVLLDIEAAHILELEVVDADGDRTHITFADVRLDQGIRPNELTLVVPKGTGVSRPLEAEGTPAVEGKGK